MVNIISKFISNKGKTSAYIKRAVLLIIVIFFVSSPITCLIFEIPDPHIGICKSFDEDDLKEKVVFPFDDEIEDQKLHRFQKQLSPNSDIFLTDFNPEVPFPPPKNI